MDITHVCICFIIIGEEDEVNHVLVILSEQQLDTYRICFNIVELLEYDE